MILHKYFEINYWQINVNTCRFKWFMVILRRVFWNQQNFPNEHLKYIRIRHEKHWLLSRNELFSWILPFVLQIGRKSFLRNDSTCWSIQPWRHPQFETVTLFPRDGQTNWNLSSRSQRSFLTRIDLILIVFFPVVHHTFYEFIDT